MSINFYGGIKMCIWEIDFDVEKYMWCIFKKTKNMDFSQFSDLFYDTETIAEKLPPKIVFHNKDKDNNPIADIMMCTGTYNGIVSQRFKDLVESQYSGQFDFFASTLKESPQETFYIFVPKVYVKLEDVLDMENSGIEYIGGNKKRGLISDINKYKFNEKIKEYHFFKITYGNGIKECLKMFCDDNFKEFIEQNNLTGLIFTKIFDFDD